jgi:hypothetical protein
MNLVLLSGYSKDHFFYDSVSQVPIINITRNYASCMFTQKMDTITSVPQPKLCVHYQHHIYRDPRMQSVPS